jgi:hypothetical protein
MFLFANIDAQSPWPGHILNTIENSAPFCDDQSTLGVNASRLSGKANI